jgi:isopenicillin-N epimerase
MDRRRFLLGSAALPALGVASTRGDAFAGLPDGPPEDPHDETYWHALRWHFYIPKGHAYCNSGTLGSTPKVGINAVNDHQIFVEQHLSSSTYKSGHPTFLGGYQDEPTLRTRVGKIMGCSMQETALTRNATMGMSYVAMGLMLGKGDEVVMTDQEHGGGRSAYDVRVKRDGVKIVEVEIGKPPKDPKSVVDAFARAITDRTRVVAIPHMTSALGLLLPVKEVTEMVKARNPNIFVVVDGAQTLGHVKVDVRSMGCDAYFSSPHKWLLAPKGNGVLYVRKGSNTKVWTTIASGQWDFQDDVGRRFSQIGTGNQSLHKGFEAVLDFLERIGIDTIIARIKTLGDRLRKGLSEIDGVTIHSATHPEMCAGMTNYAVRGWTPEDTSLHLWRSDKIMPRAAGDGIRQSLHIYNTFEDVDRTLARIRKMAANPPKGK